MATQDPTRVDIRTDPRRQRMTGTTVHGNLKFDVPFISQIEGNLWQGGCEEGMVLPGYFRHLVSLYPWEMYTVRHELDSKLFVMMYDSLDQAFGQVDALARWVRNCVQNGPTLVHCQAGLNRSSLVAGRTLTMMGYTGKQAIRLLRERRSEACLCNTSFETWLAGKRASGKKQP